LGHLPESRTKYDRLVAEWLANGRQRQVDPASLTVNELALQYWQHAEDYYRRPDGTPTDEIGNIRAALRPIKRLYGNTPAAEFSPRALEAVRKSMIDESNCRTNINQQVGRIKRMFRWAVAKELVPASVYYTLQAVPGLRRGRTEARESEGIKPVPDATIDATLPHLTPTLRAMVEVHRLTGMRPSEVCMMRTCDLDMTGRVWTYKPESHKTRHHGHTRTIFIGPQAQEVLKPRLKRNLQAHLFSPAESEAERRAELHATRKTPLSYGNRPGSNRVRRPQRQPGQRYDRNSYRNAVQYACKKAGLSSWTPGQLRHTYATRVRRDHGLEAAQVLLGHRHAAVTEVYAERDVAKAVTVAALVG